MTSQTYHQFFFTVGRENEVKEESVACVVFCCVAGDGWEIGSVKGECCVARVEEVFMCVCVCTCVCVCVCVCQCCVVL